MPEGIVINRRQLEAIFGDDFEALRQFELLLEQIDEWLNVGIPAGNISVDVSNFDNLLSSSDTSVQIALETLDDITTSEIPEGTNLYFTDARARGSLSGAILEYGFESINSSTTVTKTTTVFTGSTTGQTITLPTSGTAGRKVVVINYSSVSVSISGSSVISILCPGEDWEFTDTGSDWI